MLKKPGKWFSPEEAADYIGGYVIFNDITARDIQRGEMRSGVFSFCKAIDTFCPLGPWIVTPDELGDPHDLAMELRVNGEVRQQSHSSRMSVTIPEILSNFSALGYSAGDVLSTGTVAGVAGFKSEEERAPPVPEARRRDRGGDRAHRRAAQPGRLVAGRPRRACAAAHPPLGRRVAVAWLVARGVGLTTRSLTRVRALMAEHELDALVVRAPDNVLYLTNFWGMKGYDACVFPREGEPVLITIEASAEDAARTSWTSDVLLIEGYAPNDPRPGAGAHARCRARGVARTTAGSVSSCRWARRRPTAWSASRRRSRRAWFDAWPDAADAMPVLNAARAIKTAQEVERIRLANEICAAAMEHVRAELRPGMRESEAAAIWQGFVHGRGTGWEGKVELAFRFSLVWAGRGIKTFTATGVLPVREGEPTLFEIWVCADGYWADHTKILCIGELRDDYRELETGLLEVYRRAIDHCRPGACFAELDVLVRDGLTELGYPDQPTHPICHGVGARAHEPPYAHRAGGGEVAEGMVLAIEPGCYWQGGGGLRVEDNFLITADGAEKLSPFPDGVVTCPPA